MHHAVPDELGVLQPRYQLKHSFLFAPLQPGLKPDQAPQRSFAVLLPQLYHRPGPASGTRIGKADRLHRSKSQCFWTASRKLLNGNAHFEENHLALLTVLLKVVLWRQLGSGKSAPEGQILLFV